MIFNHKPGLRLKRLLMALFIFGCVAGRPSVLTAAEAETDQALSLKKSFFAKEKWWGEIYFESVARQDEKYNLVSDVFIKQGLHAFKIREKDLDLYFKARLFMDSEHYYWNNRCQFGLGTRYRPFSDLGLIVFLEMLHARYIGRDRADEPNPDDSPYTDLQGGLAFWQWWGQESWQLQVPVQAYVPFTGWRELYGDCIYYHHTDRDIILTLDYKEGLLLGKINKLSFDSYLALNFSYDTRAYEWNNHISIGPGLRLKPFENLDLKISVEYLWDYYYRGGFEDFGRHNSGLVFTLAFWHGW